MCTLNELMPWPLDPSTKCNILAIKYIIMIHTVLMYHVYANRMQAKKNYDFNFHMIFW